MLSEKINKVLNNQIKIEAESSQAYLAMACWADTCGYEGAAQFLFEHSDEERQHMLKLIHFVNTRGGNVEIFELSKPKGNFENMKELFEALLEHEVMVSENINNLVAVTFEEKDFATHNFLQWYVSEQIEEEALARSILDKMALIGETENGLYLIDNELKALTTGATPSGLAQ